MADGFWTGDASTAAEVALPLASLTLFIVYYLVQGCCERQGLAEAQGGTRLSMATVMRHARRAWVHVHHGTSAGPAVNTLRDYIRSSSFFASSLVVVAFGLVGLIITAYPSCLPGATSNNATADCSPSTALLMGKVALLGSAFLLSAFFFSQAVRLATHAEFLITVPGSGGEHATIILSPSISSRSIRHARLGITPAFIASVLDRATANWSWGLRTLYFTPVLALGVLSPWLTLVAVAVMLIALFRLDHLGLPYLHMAASGPTVGVEEDSPQHGGAGAGREQAEPLTPGAAAPTLPEAA